jgi:hypothetical protein
LARIISVKGLTIIGLADEVQKSISRVACQANWGKRILDAVVKAIGCIADVVGQSCTCRTVCACTWPK